MAPHRQWCYTPEKGTHWYPGPKEKFAPLYQFVRRHAELFDGYESHADLGIVVPHRALLKNSRHWFEMCNQLAAQGVSYRLLLAGDEIVDHPLSADDLNACRMLLVPDRENLMPTDHDLVSQRAAKGGCFATVSEVMSQTKPAVRVEPASQVRALPRLKPGSAVIHLLNYQYDAARDDVQMLSDVSVLIDLSELGVAHTTTCRWVTPDAEPIVLPIDSSQVQVPSLGLWGLLVLGDP
jgi:hypothetical protein